MKSIKKKDMKGFAAHEGDIDDMGSMVSKEGANTTDKVANNTDDQEQKDAEKALAFGTYIKGSFKWRMAYMLMRFIMMLEGLVWNIMDLLRGWRMSVASRINSNYQLYKK